MLKAFNGENYVILKNPNNDIGKQFNLKLYLQERFSLYFEKNMFVKF